MSRLINEELWYGTSDDGPAEQRAATSCAARVGRIIGAKPFPVAAQRIATMTRNPEVRIEELVRILESDAALSARLLRLVNSVGFSLRSACTSVHHAVALVGMDKLNQVATTAAIMDMYETSSSAAAQILEHATITGALCRYLALHFDLPPDELFTCGFLHDIGKLMLLEAEGEAYQALLESCTEADQIHQAEREMLGYDHALLAGHVLKAWSIPAPVPKVVAWHHQITRAYEDSPFIARMVSVLRLADAMSYAMKAEDPDEAISNLAHSESASYLNVSEAQLDTMWPELARLADRARRVYRGENVSDSEYENTSPMSERLSRRASRHRIEEENDEEEEADLEDPSLGNIVPLRFACTVCQGPSDAYPCPSCGGNVCSEHITAPEGWCLTCQSEFQEFSKHRVAPVLRAISGVGLGAVAFMSFTPILGAEKFILSDLVGPLSILGASTVTTFVGARWLKRALFLRTRSDYSEDAKSASAAIAIQQRFSQLSPQIVSIRPAQEATFDSMESNDENHWNSQIPKSNRGGYDDWEGEEFNDSIPASSSSAQSTAPSEAPPDGSKSEEPEEVVALPTREESLSNRAELNPFDFPAAEDESDEDDDDWDDEVHSSLPPPAMDWDPEAPSNSIPPASLKKTTLNSVTPESVIAPSSNPAAIISQEAADSKQDNDAAEAKEDTETAPAEIQNSEEPADADSDEPEASADADSDEPEASADADSNAPEAPTSEDTSIEAESSVESQETEESDNPPDTDENHCESDLSDASDTSVETELEDNDSDHEDAALAQSEPADTELDGETEENAENDAEENDETEAIQDNEAEETTENDGSESDEAIAAEAVEQTLETEEQDLMTKEEGSEPEEALNSLAAIAAVFGGKSSDTSQKQSDKGVETDLDKTSVEAKDLSDEPPPEDTSFPASESSAPEADPADKEAISEQEAPESSAPNSSEPILSLAAVAAVLGIKQENNAANESGANAESLLADAEPPSSRHRKLAETASNSASTAEASDGSDSKSQISPKDPEAPPESGPKAHHSADHWSYLPGYRASDGW